MRQASEVEAGPDVVPMVVEAIDWLEIGFPVGPWWIAVKLERHDAGRAEFFRGRGELVYDAANGDGIRIRVTRRRRRASDAGAPSVRSCRPGSRSGA